MRLTRAKEQAGEALQASNDRLKALLAEVNHWVADSLQLVSSLVHMQMGVGANACKYAYRQEEPGEARISLLREAPDGDVVRTVEDDGRGLAASGLADAPVKGTGLGGKVVSTMAASLKSAIEFDASYSGVRAQVRFSA